MRHRRFRRDRRKAPDAAPANVPAFPAASRSAVPARNRSANRELQPAGDRRDVEVEARGMDDRRVSDTDVVAAAGGDAASPKAPRRRLRRSACGARRIELRPDGIRVEGACGGRAPVGGPRLRPRRLSEFRRSTRAGAGDEPRQNGDMRFNLLNSMAPPPGSNGGPPDPQARRQRVSGSQPRSRAFNRVQNKARNEDEG